MKTRTASSTGPTLMPNLRVEDGLAAYWLQQVHLRLRRELAWLWHGQGLLPETAPGAGLPKFTDPIPAILDQEKFWEEKQQFFRHDPAAQYLTEALAAKPPEVKAARAGSLAWVISCLNLNALESFTLALGLTAAVDSTAGPVLAACLNNPNHTLPSLALVQRLWDEPEAVLSLADPAHPLYCSGLLQYQGQAVEGSMPWDRPLALPPLVAQQLLQPADPIPDFWTSVMHADDLKTRPSEANALLLARLSLPAERVRYVPILGQRGAPVQEVVRDLSGLKARRAVRFAGDPLLLKQPNFLSALVTLCWLQQTDLFLDVEQVLIIMADRPALDLEQLPQLKLPVTVFLGILDRRQTSRLPADRVLPVLEIPRLDYQGRLQVWQESLGDRAVGLDAGLAECSRRFRFEKNTIQRICQGLRRLPAGLDDSRLLAACRQEVVTDLGDLAQPVIPRFQDEELILPARQEQQFREILHAMQSLTEVHYAWGTEKVWNESGISVLFAGPPGTGKTMAAEILALKLNLPMYRIDLSQVASKYIGETEKNLKRVFDAADISDTLLFFDEADALFGRRTDVRDAHDRYANLEISYLLERMERFQGLAILATNRKKDLDEAFLRRLRYILDFPLPGENERRRMWKQMIPAAVDASALDLDFLARQFSLAGGHIRSLLFNACLQSAGTRPLGANGHRGHLGMEQVLLALKREYEKLNRSFSLEQFGAYAGLVGHLEQGDA